MILIVDLDTQKGQPSEHEALRVVWQSRHPRGRSRPRPALVRQVGIGSRMRMVFADVGEGLSLPMWTLDEEAEQPQNPWRYPQEYNGI